MGGFSVNVSIGVGISFGKGIGQGTALKNSSSGEVHPFNPFEPMFQSSTP